MFPIWFGVLCYYLSYLDYNAQFFFNHEQYLISELSDEETHLGFLIKKDLR